MHLDALSDFHGEWLRVVTTKPSFTQRGFAQPGSFSTGNGTVHPPFPFDLHDRRSPRVRGHAGAKCQREEDPQCDDPSACPLAPQGRNAASSHDVQGARPFLHRQNRTTLPPRSERRGSIDPASRPRRSVASRAGRYWPDAKTPTPAMRMRCLPLTGFGKAGQDRCHRSRYAVALAAMTAQSGGSLHLISE